MPPDKPVLNVFRMFGLMRGNYIPVDGSGIGGPRADEHFLGLGGSGTTARFSGPGGSEAATLFSGPGGYAPAVNAYASADKHAVYVMVWNYAGDDVPGPAVSLPLVLRHLPASVGKVSVTEYRIDGDHSNAYEAWKRMGSPQHPTVTQYRWLEAAGQLQTVGPARGLRVKDGEFTIPLRLPRQAVALLRVEF